MFASSLIISGGTFTGGAGPVSALLVNVSSGAFTVPTSTLTINGNLTVSGGTFTITTGTVDTNNVSITGGTLTATSGTFNVAGNWLQTGGTLTSGSNTINFTSTGTQSLDSGGFTLGNIVTLEPARSCWSASLSS